MTKRVRAPPAGKKLEGLGTRIKFNMASEVAPQPSKKTLSKNLMEMKVAHSNVPLSFS